MINVNNSNTGQLITTSSKKVTPVEMDQSLNNTSKKKKKNETADTSNNRLGVSDKSTNKSLSSSDIKGDINLKKEIPKNNKLMRNKTVSLADSKKKARVKFKKEFVSIVVVESYKKYNVDMSYNDSESNETTKCRCLVF